MKPQAQKSTKKTQFTLNVIDTERIDKKYNIASSKETEKKKKQSTFFTLKGININQIDQKYNTLEYTAEKNFNAADIPEESTHLDEIIQSHQKVNIQPFIDENHKYYVTMVDCITNQKLAKTNCFWCKEDFDGNPIGCPVEYVPKNIVKKCVSDITKEKYTIQQNVSSRVPESRIVNGNEYEFIPNDYYKTDGVFCSFNCCMAWINDMKHVPLYKHSKYLLMKMYIDIFSPSTVQQIYPSPSWRLLKKYGGFMTIEEFRNSMNEYIYLDTHYSITKLPKVHPIGKMYQEYYIF